MDKPLCISGQLMTKGTSLRDADCRNGLLTGTTVKIELNGLKNDSQFLMQTAADACPSNKLRVSYEQCLQTAVQACQPTLWQSPIL